MPLFNTEAQLKAVVEAMFSSSTPSSEATGGSPGNTMQIPYANHQHPRITSADTATITSGSTVNIMFTKTFDKQPAIDLNLIEANTPTQQPCLFAVVDWLSPTGVSLGTNPVDGVVIGGCTVKAWRSTPVPQNLVALLVGAAYSLFGGSVTGIRFSYIAVASSRT